MAIKLRTIFQSLASGSAPLKGKISSTIQILPAPGTTGLAHGFIPSYAGVGTAQWRLGLFLEAISTRGQLTVHESNCKQGKYMPLTPNQNIPYTPSP